MRRGFAAFAVVVVVIPACLVEVPPLAEPPADAASPIDASSTDAPPTPTEASPNGCTNGLFATPLRTFDANPTAKGDICNLDGVLAKGDSKLTGLDRNGSTGNVDVGGRPETSCIGIEIDPHPLSEIALTVGAAAMACDVACDGDNCGTHAFVEVFVMPSGASDWTFLQTVDTTRTVTDFSVPVPGSLPAIAKIAVCRGDGGTTRDDQVIDFVGPRCR